MRSLQEILCWEFHLSRFCLFYHDWKAFSFTPWLPYKHFFQWVYVLYRWITLLLFLSYLLRTSISFNSPYYLQFLTNWGLIVLVAYLIWAAVSVTYTYIRTLLLKKAPHKPSYTLKKEKLSKPPGCCGTSVDSTSWFHKIHWVFFTIGNEIAVGITILYWAIIAGPGGGGFDEFNVAIHLLNGIFAYLELWITGIPVRIYHFVYVVIFGIIYSVFTGIHYATLIIPNTTDPIYPVIDYAENPDSAAVYVLVIVFIFYPLLHLFFYISYLLREAILAAIKKCKDISNEDHMELKETSMAEDV